MRVTRAKVAAVWLCAIGVVVSHAEGQEPPRAEAAAPVVENVEKSESLDHLLNLDLDQLSKVRVNSPRTTLTAPSNQLQGGASDLEQSTTTADLLMNAPSVSARRTSAINLDPRVRGYHSSQLNASANGMTQLKTRLDIDSVFSQIDPGIVDRITVIDGPYSSLYGPGFAFLVADLLPTPRYERTESHISSHFTFGSNGQTIYNRDNAWIGGADWGAVFSYGLRTGNDYVSGGGEQFPSSYNKWDGLFAISHDLNPYSRIEFNYLRTELNNVELPGVVYDLNHSGNNQFNLRYVIHDGCSPVERLVLQTWWGETKYSGDASRPSKQSSLYYNFFTLPNFAEMPVNTVGRGDTVSLGARLLRTFGEQDATQLTVGIDWRRTTQHYSECNYDAVGTLVFDGNVFGIPKSRMDDVGCLANLLVPLDDCVSVNIGGRLDWCRAAFDSSDPVVTQFTDPNDFYFVPGFEEPGRRLGMLFVSGKAKLTDELTVNGGTAYAMRMPDLAELYTDEPYSPVVRFGNSYLDGNSTLRPERNWQVDLGLTYQCDRQSCGVRGFFASLHDYIALSPAFIDPAPPAAVSPTTLLGRNFQDFPPIWRRDLDPGNVPNADTAQAGYQYVNIDWATMLGGDLFAEATLCDGISVYGSMAYVRGTNHSPVSFVHDPSWSAPDGVAVPLDRSESLPGIYPLNGTLSLRLYDPNPQCNLWGLELSSRLVARRDYLATSLSEIGNPGFAVFDVHGYYRLSEQFLLTYGVKNLLDRNYAEPGSLVILNSAGVPVFLPEPGISAFIGVDGRF